LPVKTKNDYKLNLLYFCLISTHIKTGEKKPIYPDDDEDDDDTNNKKKRGKSVFT
jgi:hypothetical protein